MMNKKVFVKLIALLMAAAMLLGVCACSATDNNPTIGKIGKVKIKLSQYQQIYQQYSYYAKSMDDFNGFIKNQLITYGVTLNKCYELGLDKETVRTSFRRTLMLSLIRQLQATKSMQASPTRLPSAKTSLNSSRRQLKKQALPTKHT